MTDRKLTPEEFLDEFIVAYLDVLKTDVLITSHAGELINTSVGEFIKPWCNKIRVMQSAAVAERLKEQEATITTLKLAITKYLNDPSFETDVLTDALATEAPQ